jgi:hypothetical protein
LKPTLKLDENVRRLQIKLEPPSHPPSKKAIKFNQEQSYIHVFTPPFTLNQGNKMSE